MAVSLLAYAALILGTGVERIIELVISRRNAAVGFSRGAREYGKAHFPWMVALHTGLLLSCFGEAFFASRPFIAALGIPMLLLTLAAQAGRYWVIWALGSQWNTRVIVIPGAGKVTRGPYRLPWLRHPNYWIVAIEGIALPLVHTAFVTAIVFTILNAVLLLGFRIPTENRALASLER